MEDEADIRARLRGETLRPAAGERAREKERHIRAGRRGQEEAGDDIGCRKEGVGKNGVTGFAPMPKSIEVVFVSVVDQG